MKIHYPEIGICGLSCRLCPRYHMDTASRCHGCKTESRMNAGCSFITCAIRKKSVEFCWYCPESRSCERWKRHREAGEKVDSFKSYQKLEENIAFINQRGIDEFEKRQKSREQLLCEMLQKFNEGRSKSYYCVAATVLEIAELKKALATGKQRSYGLDIKDKSRLLHAIIDDIARQKQYSLKLRKAG